MSASVTWPDGTVRLPAAIESWLDGHFDGEKDDDPENLERDRAVTAVALWSLIYRQGDPDTDQAALDALHVHSQSASSDEVRAAIQRALRPVANADSTQHTKEQ